MFVFGKLPPVPVDNQVIQLIPVVLLQSIPANTQLLWFKSFKKFVPDTAEITL